MFFGGYLSSSGIAFLGQDRLELRNSIRSENDPIFESVDVVIHMSKKGLWLHPFSNQVAVQLILFLINFYHEDLSLFFL